MTPIIRKFVLKLLSKDRGSGITSLPGAQHRMIQESIITDTLLKKGVNPETITSEGMLQSILNGIKKEEAMIARSKAEAQKQLATVMDMKGRKIRPGAKIMGGEEVVETEAEIAERLGKGNKQAVENIKEKQLIESFDPDEMATGGRAGYFKGKLVKGIASLGKKKKKKTIVMDDDVGSAMAEWARKNDPEGYAKIQKFVDDLNQKIELKRAKRQKGRKDHASGGRAGFKDGNGVYDEKDLLGKRVRELMDEGYEFGEAVRQAMKEGYAEGGRAGFKSGSKWTDKITKWAGGKSALAGELGLEGLNQLYHLLNMGGLYSEGGRAGFAAGGMGRRAFLKLMAALGATGVAAKSGLVSLLGKGKGKQIAKELTEVPIKQTSDMPAWFKPLVNRVIKEGEDVTKQNAFKERMVVHKTKLPDSKTDVYVNQDLDSGDVWVDIGMEKHGFADGKFGQPVRLEYKASEVIEPTINTKTGKVYDKGGKTKEEFWVEEAEFTGGHPENVKFEESTFEKFGNHESNFDEVEAFATGKSKKDARKVTESFDKMNEDLADHFSNMPDPDDYADGGRVPRWMGGGLTKGKRTLAELLKYMSKGSSHGKSPSEMLKMINPKQFNEMLDRPEGIPSIAREMIEKYTKEMKGDRANMIEELIVTGRKIKKVDDDLVNYKIKIVEDMVSKGVDRATAKEMAEILAEMVEQGAGKRATPKITDEGLLEMENIQKNLATKDRKLNASGGIARMLGE